MDNNLTLLGFSDIFYNYPVVIVAIFLLMFVLYFQVLIRTQLGKGENRGVAALISFILAILTAYGIAVKGFGLPWLSIPGFDFLSIRFPNLANFFDKFGFFGILIIIAMLGV